MLSRLVITLLLRSKLPLISWLQSPSAVILEPRKINSATVYRSTSLEMMGPDAMIFATECSPLSQLFHSSFTFIKRLFSSSSLSAITVVSSHIWLYWYFSWKSWFQLVLLPAQRFSWCTLHINYISRVTIYSLNVLFFLLGTRLLFHVSSNCCFLTCIQISQEAGQVVWYSHLLKTFPLFSVIHIVKGFDIVHKAEIDVFLELSCFFHDPADVGNLISDSFAFL